MRNFDLEILHSAIEIYKKNFSFLWYDNGEKYKWEAIKCFQDNWNIDAPDFANMLEKSLSKTVNLLASVGNYPSKMIKDFAKLAPEEVRAMFKNLYDESGDYVERILAFKNKSQILLEKYASNENKHYQHENAISVYLWLYNPDKYYIYRLTVVKNVSEYLKSSYSIKKGKYRENLVNSFNLYNEINDEIKNDRELLSIFKAHLKNDSDCYSDPEYKTLTMDLCFYISDSLCKNGKKERFEDTIYTDTLETKVTYLSEIISALNSMNGKGSLNDICNEIKKRGKLVSINTNPNWTRNVSAEIQKHCKETKSYSDGNEDLFYSVDGLGKGIWGLKNMPMNNEAEIIEIFEAYSESDFLNDVYMDRDKYFTIKSRLIRKKNIILQGAPGVGKTYAAKKLAYSTKAAFRL